MKKKEVVYFELIPTIKGFYRPFQTKQIVKHVSAKNKLVKSYLYSFEEAEHINYFHSLPKNRLVNASIINEQISNQGKNKMVSSRNKLVVSDIKIIEDTEVKK